jgi:hypothetical protein
MKKNISKDLEQIVERIQNGTFSGVELRSFLIIARYAKPRSYILEELGDFVAHYDERNRGILYKHIDSFMRKFLDFATSKRPSVTVPRPPFDQKKVISALVKFFEANKILGYEESKLKSQTFNVMFKILEIIAEVEIANAPVENCRFSAVERTDDTTFTVFFCFGPVKGTLVNIKKEVRIPALVAIKD